MSAQGYLAIALHVPVFKEEVFAGSLAILIQINKLGQQYLGNNEVRETGNVWLINENGVEIYCPLSEHIGRPMLNNMIKTVQQGRIIPTKPGHYFVNDGFFNPLVSQARLKRAILAPPSLS